jgi:hypothetical protein
MVEVKTIANLAWSAPWTAKNPNPGVYAAQTFPRA